MLRVFAILIFALHAVLPAGIRFSLWCGPCEAACCTEAGACGCGSSCCEQPADPECCGECEAAADQCGGCECLDVADCAAALLIGDCTQCCCCTQTAAPASGVIAERPADLKKLLGFSEIGDDIPAEPFYSAFATAIRRGESEQPERSDTPPDSRRRQARLCIWTI